MTNSHIQIVPAVGGYGYVVDRHHRRLAPGIRAYSVIALIYGVRGAYRVVRTVVGRIERGRCGIFRSFRLDDDSGAARQRGRRVYLRLRGLDVLIRGQLLRVVEADILHVDIGLYAVKGQRMLARVEVEEVRRVYKPVLILDRVCDPAVVFHLRRALLILVERVVLNCRGLVFPVSVKLDKPYLVERGFAVKQQLDLNGGIIARHGIIEHFHIVQTRGFHLKVPGNGSLAVKPGHAVLFALEINKLARRAVGGFEPGHIDGNFLHRLNRVGIPLYVIFVCVGIADNIKVIDSDLLFQRSIPGVILRAGNDPAARLQHRQSRHRRHRE